VLADEAAERLHRVLDDDAAAALRKSGLAAGRTPFCRGPRDVRTTSLRTSRCRSGGAT
jgi:hypothetical protein